MAVEARLIRAADLYDRPARIVGWDQTGVRRGRVLIVGLGNIGDPVAVALARAGVGTLAPGRLDLLDSGVVEIANLSRGVSYLPADVGRPKAECLAERLRAINPLLRVRAIVGDVRWDLGTARFGAADLLFMATHDVPSRRHVNKWSLRYPRRLRAIVNGAIEERSYLVQTIIPGHTPCYGCTHPPDPRERADVPGCNGLVLAAGEQPTGTNGLMGLAAAAHMANEGVLMLAGFPPLFAGKELRLGQSGTVQVLNEAWSPGCRDHVAAPADTVLHVAYTAESTVGSIRAQIAERTATPSAEVRLFSPLLLVTALRCDCGAVERLVRPRPQAASISPHCPSCGSEDAERFRPETTRELASDAATLAERGLPAGQSLVAFAGRDRYEILPEQLDDAVSG